MLGAEWSGAGTIQQSIGLAAYGFGELQLRNDGQQASVLTLSNLAPHSQVTLSFSLAMWDSIDLGGDVFRVTADGNFVINETFGNYYPDNGSVGPGTLLTPATNGAFNDPQLGYNEGFRDSGRAVTLSFEHSAADLVLAFVFPNSQGGSDESFGVDNVVVSTNATAPVPLPATLPMMGLGLAGLLGLRARRKA